MTASLQMKKSTSLKDVFQGVAYVANSLIGLPGEDGYAAAGALYDRVALVGVVAKHAFSKI